MGENIRTPEVLSSVKWYFELKNLSLKNALSLRCPLSVENQKDLRQYYSQYFAGLLSATELLLEKEYPNRTKFKEALEAKLIFDGYSDGEKNYFYLRELRNSIIHRGLDISAAAHVKGDFLLLIAPSLITNRSGACSYNAFGFYLIELIDKCERVVGNVFLDHFEKCGLFEARVSREKLIAISKHYTLKSTAMPDWAKELALKAVEELDYEEIQKTSIDSLIETLKVNVLSSFPPA